MRAVQETLRRHFVKRSVHEVGQPCRTRSLFECSQRVADELQTRTAALRSSEDRIKELEAQMKAQAEELASAKRIKATLEAAVQGKVRARASNRRSNPWWNRLAPKASPCSARSTIRLRQTPPPHPPPSALPARARAQAHRTHRSLSWRDRRTPPFWPLTTHPVQWTWTKGTPSIRRIAIVP
jgi:hypothetical protein